MVSDVTGAFYTAHKLFASFWYVLVIHSHALLLGKSCIRGQQILSLALFGLELFLQFPQICKKLATTCSPNSVDSVGLFRAILKFSSQALV